MVLRIQQSVIGAGIPPHGRNGVSNSPMRGDATHVDVHHRGGLSPDHRRLLRRLTLNDEGALELVLTGHDPELESLIDGRTRSLVRMAGLVALDSEETSLQTAVDHAHGAGVSDEELVDTVLALDPVIGHRRTTSALPRLVSVIDAT